MGLEIEEWRKALTKLKFYVSVFNTTQKNFSLFTRGYWTESVIMKRIKNVLELRDLSDLDVHINEVRNRGTKIDT